MSHEIGEKKLKKSGIAVMNTFIKHEKGKKWTWYG